MCVQNVSVDYLNNNAKQADGTAYTGDKITASVQTYIHNKFMVYRIKVSSESRMSEYRWFKNR